MADTDRRIQKGEKVVGAGSASTDVANRRMDGYHDASGRHLWLGGTPVASAATITIPDNENSFPVTGTVTIAGINNSDATYIGANIQIKFSASLTLTHNGTSFIMPNGVDYQTTANEIVVFHEVTAGNWEFVSGSVASSINKGDMSRAKFTYSTTTAILIDSAWCHTDGATEQVVNWDAQITYTFGSGGSNAGSTDLGASEEQYLYIDDSSVSAGTDLIASNFINTLTTPTYSQSKHGWYNGNDRCICAFRTTGASLIQEFNHSGDYFQYGLRFKDATAIAPSTTPTDVTLTMPSFSIRAQVAVEATYVNATATVKIRANGVTVTGHDIVKTDVNSGATRYNSLTVVTDSAGIIELWWNAATTNTIDVETNGWFFPKGM